MDALSELSRVTLLGLASVPLAGRAAADTPPFPLVDISAQALPGVATTCGSPFKNYIIEVNGGGLVAADFNLDGHVDLVVIDGSTLERVAAGEPGLPPRLFLGRGDATFAPAPDNWGLTAGRWGMGGTAADFNGDGYPDLVVTEWGTDRIFLNEGGAGFREVAESGLVGRRWGTSAAALDFDRDGKLDLVVVNYLAFRPDEIASRESGNCEWKGHAVMCGPEGLIPVHDQLYRGAGDGTFEEVSQAVGYRPDRAAFGLGVMTCDHDGDGDTDIYVSNDSTPNHLFENQGDGTFVERGFMRGVGYDANGREQAGMGIACGDVNGDGRPELFVTNFSGESNALYRSSGKVGYRERASASGLFGSSLTRLGWGTGFGDFDLDGALDLFVLNGHVYPAADEPGTDTSYAQPDQLYWASAEGRFEARDFPGPARVSRAGLTCDLDGDGDLDVVALSSEGEVAVWRNDLEASPQRRWLAVEARSASGNRFAVGARVEVQVGDRVRSAEIRTTGGFQAGVPARVHFGLGAVEQVERVTVRFPSGAQRSVENVDCDQVLVVEEPQ